MKGKFIWTIHGITTIERATEKEIRQEFDEKPIEELVKDALTIDLVDISIEGEPVTVVPYGLPPLK